MSRNTVCKYVHQLEEKELITTESTSIRTSKGEKRNGNLLYTILPIEQAKKYFYDCQLENLDRVIADEKRKKKIEKQKFHQATNPA